MGTLPGLLGGALALSELCLYWRRRSSREPKNQEADGGSLKMLWRVISTALTAGYLLAAFGVGPLLPTRLAWGAAGLGCFVAGMALRWWAIWHLGRFFTVDVALADDHRVVDTGPYRLIRHPSYSGLLLEFIGIALSLRHVLSLIVIIVPVVWAVLYRIRVEENALGSILGPPYAKYTSGTKKLVPLVY